MREKGRFRVVARGHIWPILVHELVKVVTELVCLHGINKWEPDVYKATLVAADRIKYEPWLMHAGSELWRRFLTLRPTDSPLAPLVMNIAQLPEDDSERLMFDIIENPKLASTKLRGLARL